MVKEVRIERGKNSAISEKQYIEELSGFSIVSFWDNRRMVQDTNGIKQLYFWTYKRTKSKKSIDNP